MDVFSYSNKKVKERIEGFAKEFFKDDGFLKEYAFHIKKEEAYITSKDFLKYKHLLEEMELQKVGIRFLRFFGNKTKPTTDGAQIFKNKIKKKIVVEKEQEEEFIRGFDIYISSPLEGYVAVFNKQGDCLGVGLKKGDRVFNQVPKYRIIKK